MISASVPEKIIYVCKESESIAPKFNEVVEEFYKTSAMPAFPVDALNSNTLETARRWANGYTPVEDLFNKEVEMTNEPIYEVQIVDLEIRAQGGRAYKAIVHGSFLVDIREDVMLEAMLIRGVRLGSFINCKFIWARIGAQMKLIRVGSSLHKLVLESAEFKKQKKVKSSELVVGNVYQNTNNKYVFLGFVKTAEVNMKQHSHNSWYSRTYMQEVESISKPSKYQLWYQLNYDFENNENITLNNVIEQISGDSNITYYFELTKSKSGLSKVDVKTLTLPENIIEIVKECHVENSNKNEEYYNFKYLNMTPYSKDKFKLNTKYEKLKSLLV